MNDTITQERKFYRVEKNYKNFNMGDEWITIDEVDTLASAEQEIENRKEYMPEEILYRITLVLETTTVIEPDEKWNGP